MFTSKYTCVADQPLSSHLQLLVVTNSEWSDKQGKLLCFERENEDAEWVVIDAPTPVVLGESGMAWGIGLYHLTDDTSNVKLEGDFKSPAGIFSLGCVFGFFPRFQMAHLKMDYLELAHCVEAVDDPQSTYYNQVVDNTLVISDWKSSEKMRVQPLYEIGLIINHNYPIAKPGKGSAIFFHLWRNSTLGTAGCTAMCQENLEKILSWLDKRKKPVLIQLPDPIYSQLKSEWHFPDLAYD